MKFKLFVMGTVLLSAVWALAANMDDYVTPNSWSKNITASGFKASGGGLDLGRGGSLTMGLTTRYQLQATKDLTNSKGFQYFRARLSEARVGDGTMAVNLNMRVGVDFNMNRNNPREYYVFYDGLDVEAGGRNAAYRLYMANVVLDDVVKDLKVTLGRQYLDNLGDYKIDGLDTAYSFLDDAVTARFFYGLPVSYYSNLKTQVLGGGLDFKLFNDMTRLRLEYNYFISDKENVEKNTNVFRARLDQRIFFANIYGEIDQIHSATVYKVGADGNIDATGTGFSIYLNGQYDRNDTDLNPYIAAFEDVTGRESQYVMWGVQLYQGITPYLMVGAGYESRYNYDEDYADRDFHRVYGNIDFINVFLPNNFLSVIADYYIVPSHRDNGRNDKLLIGGRMTQGITDRADMWLGFNVAGYHYKGNPIRLNPAYATNLTDFDYDTKTESTTDAYIGAQWSPYDWMMVQADYTFSVTNIFSSYDSDYDNCHTLALWLNFVW